MVDERDEGEEFFKEEATEVYRSFETKDFPIHHTRWAHP